jgi:hypothetical protein
MKASHLFLIFLSFTGFIFSPKVKKMIFRSTNENPGIAHVVLREGTVERRPADQLTWLSLSQRELIASGDYIRTDEDSRVQFAFGDTEGSVTLGPQSLIRVLFTGEKLVLEVSSGEISSDVRGAGNIEVHKLEQPLKELLDQKMAVQQPQQPQEPSTKEKPKMEPAPNQPETPEQKQANEAPLPPPPAPTPGKNPFRTYPKDHSLIVLMSTSSRFQFFLQKKSKGAGQLTFKSENRQTQVSFQDSDDVHCDIPTSSLEEGLVRWFYEDKEFKADGDFEFHRFSKEKVKMALAQGRAVEVIP